MKRLARYRPYLLLLALSIFAIRPLLNRGHIFGHDSFFNVIRLTQIDRCLREGLYSARWAPDFSNGYGYPIFNFISPFVYYLGEIFVLLRFDFINSIKAVYILGFVLSGILMYLFARELWGQWGGLLSALSYVYVPYRLVDIYVRSAQVEFFALTFIPLIFWSAYKFARQKMSKYFALFVLSNALLIITHNISTMIFTPFLILYLLLLILNQKNRKVGLYFIGGLLISLGITAFFWLPALREAKFVNIGIMTQGKFHFSYHFVYIRQLFLRQWSFGLSLPGYHPGEMPYQIGVTHFVLTLASFLFFRYYKNLRPQVIFFQLIFFLSLFFTLGYSSFFWEKLPGIKYAQFPWRFLMVAAFASSVLSGAIALPLGKIKARFLRSASIAIFLIFVLGANYKYCQARKSAFDYGFARDDILRYPPESGLTTTTIQDEYLPRWVKERPLKPALEKIEFPSSEMEIDKIVIKAGQYEFLTRAKSAVKIKINTFYFPGWKGYVDGEEAVIEYDNPQGLIWMNIPAGEHQVRVVFEDTAVRKGGKLISLFSLILAGLTIFSLRRR